MQLRLKEYQRTTLAKLGDYCTAVQSGIIRGSIRPERDAYDQQTSRDYFSPPGCEGIPYVCLRVPTGGGKTLLAAHAVGTIGQKLLGTDLPTCLWITPTTTIRDQTLRALRNPHHAYRLALAEGLGRQDVEVITLEEAMSNGLPRAVPLVIVTTIQSYRAKDERDGAEIESNRRIYRDNGYQMGAFDHLSDARKRWLAKDETGLVYLSLANALVLRNPIVVMDEAHNARTPTSFESLKRFGPSFVLELTATPHHEHNPLNHEFASNVLHAVGALELKTEGMIKLPVDLENRTDWLEVLAATVHRRGELETLADRYTTETGHPFIRPIALIQAQPKSATKETFTADVVKKALVEKLHVSAAEIRICIGTLDEIGNEDLMAGDCQVRYVITVDKLKEGWDCPLAYVLGSIGNAATPTAVEQLLGRVLRMPFASPTEVPALNRAYAFVLSPNVQQTAMQLRDRLISACGFDERSARDAFRTHSSFVQSTISFNPTIALSAAPRADALPDVLRARMNYDQSTRRLEIVGELSSNDIRDLHAAVITEQDRRQVQEYAERERPVGTSPLRWDQPEVVLRIPQLGLVRGDARVLFEPEELDTFNWDLDTCPVAIAREEFADGVVVGSAALIDLAQEGGVITMAARDVRLQQLELVGEGDDWSAAELARWLDRQLHRDETFQGLLPSQSQPWMLRVVHGLTGERGMSLPVIVRRRHPLAELLRGRVAAHGRKIARRAAEELIRQSPQSIEASPALVLEMREGNYAPYETFDAHRFQKHAFLQVAAMNNEEIECAGWIDGHANVKRWVRNLDRETLGGFFLPKSPGKFFPDFVVELMDGSWVAVEYKNRTLSQADEEKHKRDVGRLWSQRSGGRCRFAWVVERDWAELNRALAAQPLPV